MVGLPVFMMVALLTISPAHREFYSQPSGWALIALAVAGAVQCPYCIDSYTQSCLEKGVTEEQMTEAFHVANAIRGGAALVHGVQMKNVVKQLEM